MKILDIPQSGSIAGITSSRNRYGQYRRTRAIPVNPGTAKQSVVRARIVEAAQAWAALTGTQQNAWKAYAATHPVQDSLGQSINLSGACMYNKLSLQARSAGITPSSTPPTEASFAASSLTLAAAAGTPTLTVSAVDQPTDYKAVIFGSPQVTTGVTFPPTMRRITVVDADAWSTPADILSAYTSVWGSLVEGNRIIIDAQLVSDEGVYGNRVRNRVTIAA